MTDVPPVADLSGVERFFVLGDDEVRALQGIDLVIRRSEFVSIMGPSGSGKSTLLHVLGLLDTPTGGSYRIDGLAVEGLDEDAKAEIRGRRIGFVFQDFHLLPRLTALENVSLPLLYQGASRRARRERAESVLASVGLGHRLSHRPSALSGGERQRVAIARALVSEPAFLLADEPTGNLDSRVGGELLDLLEGLWRDRGLTLILVTHDPAVGVRARRRIRLQDGRIVADERAA
ncbi:MAG: ABC transporter ATP-binding protein [Planctomycetota bacterium]